MATTAGNLAMTGLSFASSQANIVGQRAKLDLMWETVQNLNNALASAGRQFKSRTNSLDASKALFFDALKDRFVVDKFLFYSRLRRS